MGDLLEADFELFDEWVDVGEIVGAEDCVGRDGVLKGDDGEICEASLDGFFVEGGADFVCF